MIFICALPLFCFVVYFGLFNLFCCPEQVERSVSYNEHRPRRPPPDLPSILLNGRIVYIGMPVRDSLCYFDKYMFSLTYFSDRGKNKFSCLAYPCQIYLLLC